jgi:DNA modification methylase
VNTPEIPLDSIHVGERFRKDYGDINQLMYSIKKNGLISPLAVGLSKMVAEELRDNTDKPYVLLAGGRRLTALVEMGRTMIPVNIYDQPLSSLDLRSIELAENLDRKDMAYDEEIALKAEIDSLQRQIHGPKIGRSANSGGWSQADTARLIKQSPATIAKDLQLAKAIQDHPELGLDKCKNKSEAMKLLKNIGKSIDFSVKSEQFQKTVGNTDKVFSKLSASYIIGDCFDTMKSLPTGSIDFIEIDPPYGIDLVDLKRDNDCNGYNEIPGDQYLDFMSKLFIECYRVLRNDSWLICWFGPDPWFAPIAHFLREANFVLKTLPGIWAKSQGQTQQPETYLANSYEMFFYARKGNPKISTPGRSNIFQYNGVAGSKKYHPTQRPLDLMVDLYSTFTRPNSTGFIPFLGSGVGLLAGHHCQINMMGTDLSPQFKDPYIVALNEYVKGLK